MNEKKSNAPIVAIIVVVALALIGIPCVLGTLFLVGALFWRMEGPPPQQIEFAPPPPSMVPKPQVDPAK